MRTLTGMPENSAALLRGAATEIAGIPGLADRLRRLHVAGPDGRCTGCASAPRTAPRWPCRIAVVTDRP